MKGVVCVKKLSALVLVLLSALSLIGCQNKPNTPKDHDINNVVMLYENDDDLSSNGNVAITDEEIIAELLTMHNDLRTEKPKKPIDIGPKRVWVIFRKDEKHIIEWLVVTDGKDWSKAQFVTYSTALGEDYQLIINTYDYSRLLEILHEYKDK